MAIRRRVGDRRRCAAGHDRALVVERRRWEGTVQTVSRSRRYALKLTTAKWFTPAGRSIQKDRKEETQLLASGARPGDTTAAARVNPTGQREDVPPDSLETDAVKKTRPVFRSDAGRIVYGGGGITPDVIIPDDTVTSREQEFLKAIGPKSPQVRIALGTTHRSSRRASRAPTSRCAGWARGILSPLTAARSRSTSSCTTAARRDIDKCSPTS